MVISCNYWLLVVSSGDGSSSSSSSSSSSRSRTGSSRGADGAMVIWWQCVTTDGNWFSWSSAPGNLVSGWNPS